MRILGIDTAGPASNVALIDGERVLAVLYRWHPPAFSRQILRFIDIILRQEELCLDDLDGLAVNVGPGTFTGIRIGLATAQGLALASNKPLVGCNALEALAASVSGWHGPICPVLEARHGEVYVALYCREGAVVRELMPGMVLSATALGTYITERTLFVGSGVRTYEHVFTATLGERAVCAIDVEAGSALRIARLAQIRLTYAESEPRAVPQPLYIRPADARLPRHLQAAKHSSTPSRAPAYAVGVLSPERQEGGVPCSMASMKR